ncbi:maternal protein tudor-like [Metopolophium dirhodum]|uniref:maternal protein tudor-like n=1 Tax=Metopolophium dirhodum TaxID=44670 RepID=UPI00299072DB|nr:maternal protein tudor-like [Metopolophium dirhodum]
MCDKLNTMKIKCWDAYISYFYSFKNFYIQNKNDQQTIQDITTSLQFLENEGSMSVSVKPGDLVAAKYENDGLWYRAKILSIEENAFTVQFIDYGNSELSSNLKILPEKIACYRAMAYHCMLDDVDHEEYVISTVNDIYDYIFDFIGSIEVIVTFLSDEETFLVNMKWDDRCIKTLVNNIISYGITPKTYETLKEIDQSGAKMAVNLIYAQSINEFYVETEDSKEIQNKIERILENETVWEPLTEYKIGKMAIAKSITDSRWYRVRLLMIHEEGECTCYFIDYGVQDKCSEFYEAVGYLKLAPPFIKLCSLHIPTMKKNEKLFECLSKSFTDEMELCKNKKMTITVVKTGEPIVVELFVDDFNVAKLIKPIPVIVFNVIHLNILTVQVNSPSRQAVITELSTVKTLNPVEKPKYCKMYGALVNDRWYRAELKNKFKSSMDIMLVDMGSTVINVENLYELPKHLENVKYLTLRCSLGLDQKYFSIYKLKQICNSKTEFMMIVFENNNIDGHFIRLFLNDEDVTTIIKKD